MYRITSLFIFFILCLCSTWSQGQENRVNNRMNRNDRPENRQERIFQQEQQFIQSNIDFNEFSRPQGPTWTKIQDQELFKVPNFKIGAPIQFKNLSLYPITASMKSPFVQNLETLDDALKNKATEVSETGNVQELSVKNNSKFKHLFINAGDIVKGGKQDRALSFDLWVPMDEQMPLPSFCVEQSRWEQRGEEEVGQFSENSYMLSSRKLKIAATVKKSQGEVWENVAHQQSKLSSNMSKEIRSKKSKTSLQLTLENEDLQKEIDEYKAAFANFAEGEEVIGFVYAINGELYGADYYADPALFAELRDKLMNAAMVEAVSEEQKKEAKAPTVAEVETRMHEIVEANSTEYILSNSYNLTLKWTHEKGYLMESRKNEQKLEEAKPSDFAKEDWMHRNFIFVSK